jgi:ComF family protein
MLPEKRARRIWMRTLPHCAAPPPVEYFGRLFRRLHFCLVEMSSLSDKRAMRLVLKIAKPVLDYALPQRCPSCGVISTDGTGFCTECWPKIRFLNPPWCESCALPFEYEQPEGTRCASCLAEPPNHDGIRAAVAYDALTRKIALRLKYGRKIGLAKLIARHLVRHLPSDRTGIIVVPVPLHWTRLWSRSFNQSALIAQELARLGGLHYVPDMLLRTKRTPSLRGLSGKDRRKTVAKVFRTNSDKADLLKGSRIILVDDVLTTGATSDGCVRALKKSGANWVQLFCWARALREDVIKAPIFEARDA